MARATWGLSVLLSFGLLGCSLIVDSSPLGCAPHQLCADMRSICVAGGDEPSCEPLIDRKVGCNETFPALDDLDSLRGSDIFHIGLIAARPTEFYTSEYGVPTTQAVAAAVSIINRDGLPLADEPPRKLLVSVCEEGPTTKAEQSDDSLSFLGRRVEHLAKRLRVPAIIGASTSGDTRPINNTYLRGTDVLLLSPSATDDAITSQFRGGQQLFWRTIPPDSRQIPALSKALDRAKLTVTSSEAGKMKIAAVWDTSNDAAKGLYNLFSQTVDVLSIPYTSKEQSSKDAAIGELRKDNPRFILPFGTDDFTQNMLGVYESDWPADAPRPWYIMSEGNRGDFTNALAGNDTLSSRVIGTAPGAQSADLYGRFETDFKASFGQGATPGALAECGFDAAFLLAYAATRASLDTPWPRGPELADAIKTFSCKMSDARELRATGQWFASDRGRITRSSSCYDFKGASGELDYVAVDGVQELNLESSDMALWCLGNTADAKQPYVNLESYYYNQVMMDIVSDVDGAPELSLTKPTWCADATR